MTSERPEAARGPERVASAARWVVAGLVVLCLIGLLAFRRNDPGVGGRVPDPDAVVVVATSTTTG